MALRCRFNNAGEYQEDGTETSRKWLEQISVIGVLLHFQSTLAPHLVRTGFLLSFGKKSKRMGFLMQPHFVTWLHMLETLPNAVFKETSKCCGCPVVAASVM